MNHFEDLAQQLIESSLSRLLRERLQPDAVMVAIVRAIDDAMNADPTHAPPNHFWVALSEQDLAPLQFHQPDLAEQLAENVRQTMVQMGLRMDVAPRVVLRASPDLAARQIRVAAHWISPDLPASDTATNAAANGADLPKPERCPFLIVDGERFIRLSSGLVRVGRSRENDVVVDDRRTSRHHVELRWQPSVSRFLLVDLGSSGGTRLNGFDIQQCTLEPGDVLSLGGVEVIYGEDCPDETTDAQPALGRA